MPTAAEAPALSDAEQAAAAIAKRGNHLVGEASPYLEAHAHNPVDWYPWGDEALSKAAREGKPIFVSIGYSTCHWCHVMEEESFENLAIAAFLNEHFVSIKVDREQRPDLDALYLDAVAALGGRTGWPLTVFLMPTGEPVFGGSYFPAKPQRGLPGFLDVLNKVRAMTAEGGAEEARARGKKVLAALEARARRSAPGPLADSLRGAMAGLVERRDGTRGGFGRGAKFPNAPLLAAELGAGLAGDPAALEHAETTLDAMMNSGLRDLVGGGFHRYTVDAAWAVPHFEKTLYDNAQLAHLYIEAGIRRGRADWVAVGRAVLDELLREWTVAGGGFVAGFDADSPGGEGSYYTWTREELREALPEADATRLAEAFAVQPAGKGTVEGRSVLRASARVQIDDALSASLQTLASTRAARAAPARDDKVLTGWNALAIAALSDAGRWLGHAEYVEAARAAADFLWTRCWTSAQLERGVRGATALGAGFAEDYAALGLAFVRLHAATGELVWLRRALEVDEMLSKRFVQGQAVYRSESRHDVPVRLTAVRDGPSPSGGAMTARLAWELGLVTSSDPHRERGEALLRAHAGTVAREPSGSGAWMQAMQLAEDAAYTVVLAGDADHEGTAALWAELGPRTSRRLHAVRIPADGVPGDEPALAGLAGKVARGGLPTAYVCEHGSCKRPTDDPQVLRAQLDAAEASAHP